MAVIETRMKEGSIETLHDLSVSEVNYFIRNGVHTVEELRKRLPEFEKKAPKMYQSARNALIKVNRREEIVIESDDYKRALSVTKNIKVNAEIMEQSLYEVCKGLAEVKRDKLYKPMGYSSFENYCEVEIGIKRHMAYKYVAIADIENVESIQHFGVTKLSLLAQLDENTRQEITQNTDIESTSVNELKAKIKSLEETNRKTCEHSKELEKQVEKLKEHPVQVTVEDTTKIQELEEQLRQAQTKADESVELFFKSASLKHENAELKEKIKELESRSAEVAVEEDTDEIDRLKREIESTKAEYEKRLAEVKTQKTEDISSVYKYLSRTLENVIDDLCDFFDDYDEHPEIDRFKRELNSDVASWIQDLEIRIGGI